MKKVLKAISNILIVSLFLVTIGLFVIRFTGANLSIKLPISLYRISSPSMIGDKKDSLNVGDIVIVIKKNPSKLEKGDIITYQGDKDLTGDGVKDNITHRIVDKVTISGNLMFQTKGDANFLEDEKLVSADKVIGITHKAVLITHLYNFLAKPIGFILLIALPLVALIIKEVITLAIVTEKNKEAGMVATMEIPQKDSGKEGEQNEKE